MVIYYNDKVSNILLYADARPEMLMSEHDTLYGYIYDIYIMKN